MNPVIDKYRINLARLSEGEHTLCIEIDDSLLEICPTPDIISLQAQVRGTLNVKNDAYIFRMDIEGSLKTPCHRCLEPLEIPLQKQYCLVVTYSNEYDDSGLGNDATPQDPDRLVIPENQPVLDIAPIIRDTALLQIPMRATHPEGQCNPEIINLIKQE